MGAVLAAEMPAFDCAGVTLTDGRAGNVDALTFFETLDGDFGTGLPAFQVGVFVYAELKQAFAGFGSGSSILTCVRTRYA